MGNAKKRSGSVASMLPVLLACSFTASFGQSMMNVALPELAERFGVTLSIANWVIVGYMVVAATAIMLSAFMLRRLGLRRVFFVGAGALALGSACALLSQDFPMLFASRLVQAVGTGLFFPSVTSVIMTNSPAAVRGTRLALNSGVIAVGLAISPTASGFALTQFGWRAMFVVSLAMSVALLAVGFFRIHGGPSTKRVPIDALSVMLGPLGLAAFLYGLGEVTRDLAPSLAALAVGAVLLALFAWRQFALESPLLDLHPLVHLVGIALGLCFFVPAYRSHAAFRKEHPVVEDCYTPEEKAEARRRKMRGVGGGVALLVLGMFMPGMLQSIQMFSFVPLWLFACFAAAAALLVHSVMMDRRVDVSFYNGAPDFTIQSLL